MSEAKEWKAPAPDIGVLDALHRAYTAALRGDIRALVIVTVNPLHQRETALSGDLSSVNRDVLVGGLSSVTFELHQSSESQNNNGNGNNGNG